MNTPKPNAAPPGPQEFDEFLEMRALAEVSRSKVFYPTAFTGAAIQAALDAAESGGIVQLAVGTYVMNAAAHEAEQAAAEQ